MYSYCQGWNYTYTYAHTNALQIIYLREMTRSKLHGKAKNFARNFKLEIIHI